MEFKVGYDAFPSLYGGFQNYNGSFGLRMVSGLEEEWQYYVGWRAQKIYRTNPVSGKAWRATQGFESKITRDITDNIYTGFRFTYEKANDQEIFNWTPNDRWAVWVTIGFKVFKL